MIPDPSPEGRGPESVGGETRRRARTLAVLIGVPLALRLAVAGLVVDYEADAYSHDLIAGRMAHEIRAGSATWHSVYVPAWLPGWHIVCATAFLVVHHPYWVPKILAALFGGLTPLGVFLLARRIGRDKAGANPWVAWGIATILPSHVLYSAMGMSEAFYGFWIILGVFCLVAADPTNRFLWGSAFALLPASLTRFEVWPLLPIFPLVALRQKRTSVAGFVRALPLFALGPLIWMLVSWKVTGSPFSFLGANREYLVHFFEFNPTYADRGIPGAGLELAFILLATGFVAGPLAMWGLARTPARNARALLVIALAAAGSLLFLWAIRQSVGWRRHYIAFAMMLAAGAPLAWVSIAPRARRALAALLVCDLVLCSGQALQAGRGLRWKETATFLRDREGRVYCDEPAVRVLSGGEERFVESGGMPKDPSRALAWLKSKGVKWVVFADVDYSPLPDLFPFLREGKDDGPWRFRLEPSRPRGARRILLYELQE